MHYERLTVLAINSLVRRILITNRVRDNESSIARNSYEGGRMGSPTYLTKRILAQDKRLEGGR